MENETKEERKDLEIIEVVDKKSGKVYKLAEPSGDAFFDALDIAGKDQFGLLLRMLASASLIEPKLSPEQIGKLPMSVAVRIVKAASELTKINEIKDLDFPSSQRS